MRHYDYKSISDAKFESGSFSSFGDIASQNFPRKKGMSHQMRLFNPRKRVFMSRIVLLGPKLTPMSISAISKQTKIFSFRKFLGRLDEKRTAATRLIHQFSKNLARTYLIDEN